MIKLFITSDVNGRWINDDDNDDDDGDYDDNDDNDGYNR